MDFFPKLGTLYRRILIALIHAAGQFLIDFHFYGTEMRCKYWGDCKSVCLLTWCSSPPSWWWPPPSPPARSRRGRQCPRWPRQTVASCTYKHWKDNVELLILQCLVTSLPILDFKICIKSNSSWNDQSAISFINWLSKGSRKIFNMVCKKIFIV